MTIVGHILVGSAIGILSMPSEISLREKLTYIALFALLANIPDLPFPHWGHDRYDISHSIFVNSFLISISLYLISLKSSFKSFFPKPVLIGACLAWLSHLLLDTFYGDGYGLAMFWPLLEVHVHFPIPWFSVITTGAEFSDEVKQQFTAEFLTYFPFVAIAVCMRYFSEKNRISQT